MASLNVVVFSKDRPLQLEGCLRSWQAAVVDPDQLSLRVLAYVQPPYEAAYAQVQAAHPHVVFRYQTDFARDVAELVGDSPAMCFCCDDVVVMGPVDIDQALAFLATSGVIGISLRLGVTIQRGFFQTPMRQPVFTAEGDFLTWNMNGADQDWCYPWDVLGTIYPMDFVRDMLPLLAEARNPSEFEATGATHWPTVTSRSHYACWRVPRTVVPTVNVVQDVFPNGWIGGQLPPELLLACFAYGMRLDTERYETQHYDTWRVGDLFLKRQV